MTAAPALAARPLPAGLRLGLAGAALEALGSGALWWPAECTLVVADLHLGKSERVARRGGALLPPYEGRDTLARLAADVAALAPVRVVCLGDSFDDDAAALHQADEAALAALAAGRDWVWIAGNHDPARALPFGTCRGELSLGPLTFRHEARAGARGEVSGHYHPKAVLLLRCRRVSRPCFLLDAARIVLPAFGAYTGGLDARAPVLQRLMGPDALAVLCGPLPRAVPMPR